MAHGTGEKPLDFGDNPVVYIGLGLPLGGATPYSAWEDMC